MLKDFFNRKPIDHGEDYIGLEQTNLFPGGMMHPHIAPFDNKRIAPLEIDHVPAMTGLQSPIDGHIPSVQNADTDLAMLRSIYPFVPIMPFPQATRNLLLPQNKAVDVPVSSFTLARFKGNADYFVSAQGAASGPTVANEGANFDQNASLYKPEDGWYYIGGLKQISLFAPGVNVVVCISLYSTNNWPAVF